MRAIVAIAGKDVRQRLRDRSAILMALVLPLVLAFLFNLVFGSAAVPRPFGTPWSIPTVVRSRRRSAPMRCPIWSGRV